MILLRDWEESMSLEKANFFNLQYLDQLKGATDENGKMFRRIRDFWWGEPPRDCRRHFGLSHAAMADCSIMA